MLKNYKNKQIAESENRELEEFHFSGGGEYEPLTVKARSREEAEEFWQKERKKVEKTQIISE